MKTLFKLAFFALVVAQAVDVQEVENELVNPTESTLACSRCR